MIRKGKKPLLQHVLKIKLMHLEISVVVLSKVSKENA